MYSLLSALVVATITFAAIAGFTRPMYAFLPAFALGGAVYWLIARRHSKAVEALMGDLQKEIQQRRVPNAIKMLKGAYPHAKWVFMLKGQIDGQIGTLLFIEKDFDAAIPLLEKAWVKHWPAKGMLASYWFKKHKPEQAFKILDDAITANKKEPILYGIKAFMQVKLKDADGARATLVAGSDKVPSSQPLKDNLMRLQNGEKLRMSDFGEQWWQFHLEKPSTAQAMKMAGVSGKPKGGKKAMYR
mgnify:CR=1 FL=1